MIQPYSLNLLQCETKDSIGVFDINSGDPLWSLPGWPNLANVSWGMFNFTFVAVATDF